MKSISFLLNYILADIFQFNPVNSYVSILLIDFILGYFINRYFVFETDPNKKHSKIILQFVVAGGTFRVLNWLIYIALIDHMYILTAQLIATVSVLILKYFVYKIIFTPLKGPPYNRL